MTDADIEATRAPLMDHLIELRARLIRSLAAFVVIFIVCFFFAKNIYNILLMPYEHVAGPNARLIYTAPQEYFFTQIRVAIFAAAFLSCPIIFAQLYAFVAPGLYRKERQAFAPYLFATPIFFALGALLVYFVVMPNLLAFFIGMQQAKQPGRAEIELLPRVSEYLSLIMTLDFRLRHRLSTAGGAHSAWARRHHRFRLSAAAAALCRGSRVHRRCGSDAARYILDVGACRSRPAPLRAVDHVGRLRREATRGEAAAKAATRT